MANKTKTKSAKTGGDKLVRQTKAKPLKKLELHPYIWKDRPEMGGYGIPHMP